MSTIKANNLNTYTESTLTVVALPDTENRYNWNESIINWEIKVKE
jgi:hypothetical protein